MTTVQIVDLNLSILPSSINHPTIYKLVDYLIKNGHIVEEDELIPGLWRVNNGPELTIGQMISIYGKSIL